MKPLNETNKHLRDPKARAKAIAASVYSSFALEGIKLERKPDYAAPVAATKASEKKSVKGR